MAGVDEHADIVVGHATGPPSPFTLGAENLTSCVDHLHIEVRGAGSRLGGGHPCWELSGRGEGSYLLWALRSAQECGDTPPHWPGDDGAVLAVVRVAGLIVVGPCLVSSWEVGGSVVKFDLVSSGEFVSRRVDPAGPVDYGGVLEEVRRAEPCPGDAWREAYDMARAVVHDRVEPLAREAVGERVRAWVDEGYTLEHDLVCGGALHPALIARNLIDTLHEAITLSDAERRELLVEAAGLLLAALDAHDNRHMT